ncbi:MAG: nucleotide exchange factor GrpE [Fidelibacterota bacterium]
MAKKDKTKKNKNEQNKDVIVDISSDKPEEVEAELINDDNFPDDEKEITKDKSDKKKNKKNATVSRKKYDKLKEELEEHQQAFEEMKDRYYRAAAEFDNFKKRTNKELAIIHKYAGEKVLREIIPIFDDMSRALENEPEEESQESTGMAMIHKKFSNILKNLGVEPIQTVGEDFDPDLHHALMVREEEDIEPDKVLEEFEKGYMYKDKVLKHAKVVVSK